MALNTTVGDANADSYVDASEFLTYAAEMGLSTTADAVAMEPFLRRATAYLDRTFVWKGTRRYETQALAFPRIISGYDSDGFWIPSDTIPVKVKKAQMEIAHLFENGIDLLSHTDGPEIKVEEVAAGPVKSRTEYVSGSEDRARIAAIEGLLTDYTLSGGIGASSGSLKVTRG